MSTERKKVLEMLANGKITVEEAERLLTAISQDGPSPSSSGGTGKPKYLRVLVEPSSGQLEGDRVNIRVPLNLIRAGLKWAALIPKHQQNRVNEALQQQGIELDLNKIKPEDLEDLIVQLNDLQVDVEGKEKVRIFCE